MAIKFSKKDLLESVYRSMQAQNNQNAGKKPASLAATLKNREIGNSRMAALKPPEIK